MELKCINDGYLPKKDVKPDLKAGETYTLVKEHQCAEPCLAKHYDVGLKPQAHTITCHKCGKTLPESGNVGWAAALRFE